MHKSFCYTYIHTQDPGPGERLDQAREGAADECESEEEVSTEGPISPQESLLAQVNTLYIYIPLYIQYCSFTNLYKVHCEYMYVQYVFTHVLIIFYT